MTQLKNSLLRHPAKLKVKLEQIDREDNENMLKTPVGVLYHHLKEEKQENRKNVQVVNRKCNESDDVMHAELKCLNYYLDNVINNSTKPKDTNLYIAGIKRPCVACWVRIHQMKKQHQLTNLVFNPHNGLLWASKSAWKDCEEGDKLKALEFIGFTECFFLRATNNDEYQKLKPNLLKFHIKKGKSLNKPESYGSDTESDDEGDDQNQMDVENDAFGASDDEDDGYSGDDDDTGEEKPCKRQKNGSF